MATAAALASTLAAARADRDALRDDPDGPGPYASHALAAARGSLITAEQHAALVDALQR